MAYQPFLNKNKRKSYVNDTGRINVDFGEATIGINRTRLEEAIRDRDTDYLVQELYLLQDEIEELKMELMLAGNSYGSEDKALTKEITIKRRRNFKQ